LFINRVCRLNGENSRASSRMSLKIAQLWDARFDQLDKVVEELKRKEKVDGRKKSE
jgi:hypothetical protein